MGYTYTKTLFIVIWNSNLMESCVFIFTILSTSVPKTMWSVVDFVTFRKHILISDLGRPGGFQFLSWPRDHDSFHLLCTYWFSQILSLCQGIFLHTSHSHPSLFNSSTCWSSACSFLFSQLAKWEWSGDGGWPRNQNRRLMKRAGKAETDHSQKVPDDCKWLFPVLVVNINFSFLKGPLRIWGLMWPFLPKDSLLHLTSCHCGPVMTFTVHVNAWDPLAGGEGEATLSI